MIKNTVMGIRKIQHPNRVFSIQIENSHPGLQHKPGPETQSHGRRRTPPVRDQGDHPRRRIRPGRRVRLLPDPQGPGHGDTRYHNRSGGPARGRGAEHRRRRRQGVMLLVLDLLSVLWFWDCFRRWKYMIRGCGRPETGAA